MRDILLNRHSQEIIDRLFLGFIHIFQSQITFGVFANGSKLQGKLRLFVYFKMSFRAPNIFAVILSVTFRNQNNVI